MPDLDSILFGGRLARIESKLDALLAKENQMSVDLTALQNAVAAETTVTNSAVTLIKGLAAQIAALGQQPTVDPAALQALADTLNANAKALGDAVQANTPAPAPAP